MSAWLDDIPLAGTLSDEQLSEKLGEPYSARSTVPGLGAGGRFASDRASRGPVWRHTSHTYGFIPPGASGPGAIRHVGQVEADASLKDARLRISLDALQVAEYPGSGTHQVLFDFYVQNQTDSVVEEVNFNATYRIREGGSAGVLNYPIFTGVAPQETGLVLRAFTVNVRNDRDEAFLDVIESDAFRTGLALAATAQPALKPLSSLAVGMTRAIAERHRNIAVQNVHLGLDFGGAPTGARLAVGSYVAVQMPPAFHRAWRWTDWHYDAASGQILDATGQPIALNYFIIGISRS